MKKDFQLGFERLDSIVLLSGDQWYIDAIKANQLWDTSSVGSKPVVAIVDSGVDLNHDGLKQDLWVNPDEKIDGIDNDGNGYVDDINGWNFSNNTNSLQDGFYHGTHVAGIIDAIGHGKVSIMPIKFMSDSGSGYVGAAVASINYATDMRLRGVNVVAINCSFGGLTSAPSSLLTAIQRASDNGIVVVTAAGNNGSDNDVTPRYPSSYNIANNISVAAINPDLSLAGYSNYGKTSVTIAAPGTSIYSTLPGNTYGYVSGTSMAAPMVSGSIGLLESLGKYTAQQIKDALMKGANMISTLIDKVQTGLLDVSKAFGILKTQPVVVSTPPSPPAPVVAPPAPVVPVVQKAIVYHIDTVTLRTVKGWTYVSNSNQKPVVEVYINNILRYRTIASLYRADTKSANGFSFSIDKRFFNKKSNLLEIKIKDVVNHLETIAYKGYINK